MYAGIFIFSSPSDNGVICVASRAFRVSCCHFPLVEHPHEENIRGDGLSCRSLFSMGWVVLLCDSPRKIFQPQPFGPIKIVNQSLSIPVSILGANETIKGVNSQAAKLLAHRRNEISSLFGISR